MSPVRRRLTPLDSQVGRRFIAVGLLQSLRCVVSWMLFEHLLLCNVPGHGGGVQI